MTRARLQPLLPDRRAVAAAEILDEAGPLGFDDQLRVMSRQHRIVDPDLCVGIAADYQHAVIGQVVG